MPIDRSTHRNRDAHGGARGRAWTAALGLVGLVAGATATASTGDAVGGNRHTAASVQSLAITADVSQLRGDAMRLVGEARLRVLFWSVYDSRLYTPDGEYRRGDRPLRLEIEYLLNVKASALVERTRQEWRAMGREHPRQEAWLDRLGGLWPNIEAGDVLAIDISDDDVATFRHNGRVIGRIDDAAFGQQFVDIWLSEDCTRPELRQALLGSFDSD